MNLLTTLLLLLPTAIATYFFWRWNTLREYLLCTNQIERFKDWEEERRRENERRRNKKRSDGNYSRFKY